MRKKIGLIIICTIMVIFVSCSKKDSKSEESTKSKYPRITHESINGGDNKPLFGDNILYTDSDGHLMYLDTEKGEKIIYCFDTECNHERGSISEKPKCFAQRHSSNTTILCDDYIYYFDSDSDNIFNSVLYRAQKDTSGQKKIADYQGKINAYLIEESKLYVFTEASYRLEGEMITREDETTRRVYETDLETGDSSLLFEYKYEYSEFQFFTLYQRTIFLLFSEFDISPEEMLDYVTELGDDYEKIKEYSNQHLEYKLFCIDTKSHEIKEIEKYKKMGFDGHGPVICSNYLFYSNEEKDGFENHAVNLLTLQEYILETKELIYWYDYDGQLIAEIYDRSRDNYNYYNVVRDSFEMTKIFSHDKTIGIEGFVGNYVYYFVNSTSDYYVVKYDEMISNDLSNAIILK